MFSYHYIDKLSFKNQVELFYIADNILSTHGCTLTNLMFSTPHTAAIECDPPYYFEPSYMTITMIIHVHYILDTQFYPKNQMNQHWIQAEKAYHDGIYYSTKTHYH